MKRLICVMVLMLVVGSMFGLADGNIFKKENDYYFVKEDSSGNVIYKLKPAGMERTELTMTDLGGSLQIGRYKDARGWNPATNGEKLPIWDLDAGQTLEQRVLITSRETVTQKIEEIADALQEIETAKKTLETDRSTLEQLEGYSEWLAGTQKRAYKWEDDALRTQYGQMSSEQLSTEINKLKETVSANEVLIREEAGFKRMQYDLFVESEHLSGKIPYQNEEGVFTEMYELRTTYIDTPEDNNRLRDIVNNLALNLEYREAARRLLLERDIDVYRPASATINFFPEGWEEPAFKNGLYCATADQGKKCFTTAAEVENYFSARQKWIDRADKLVVPLPPTHPLSEQERAQASALGINLEKMNAQETREKLEKLTRFSSAITSKRDFVIDQEIIKELNIKEGVYTDPLTGWQAVIKKNDQGNLFVERLLNRPEGVDLNAEWQLPTSDSRGNRIEGYYVNSETGDAWDINGETDWVHTRTFDKWFNEQSPIIKAVMEENKVNKFLSNAWKGIGSLGSWRGSSNWLAPDLTKDFVDFSDEYFGRKLQLGEHITKAYCEYDSRSSADIPGQSSLFIEGAGGTYQFVAAMQAERSGGQTPILCNDDPEIKEEDRCPGELVCKDQLCYDNEDAERPEAGYFYKIIWGVTAPQDQAYTPYIDEDGTSVKFNLKFKGASDWLYEREDGSAGDEVIELNNGAKDQGVILDYSQKIHNEACIIFNERYRPEDRSGEVIDRNFCVTIKVAAPGTVEFETEDAEERKPSATVSSGRVRGRSIFERS